MDYRTYRTPPVSCQGAGNWFGERQYLSYYGALCIRFGVEPTKIYLIYIYSTVRILRIVVQVLERKGLSARPGTTIWVPDWQYYRTVVNYDSRLTRLPLEYQHQCTHSKVSTHARPTLTFINLLRRSGDPDVCARSCPTLQGDVWPTARVAATSDDMHYTTCFI